MSHLRVQVPPPGPLHSTALMLFYLLKSLHNAVLIGKPCTLMRQSGLDTVAPDAVNRRAERTNMTWQSLDLDDCDDPPEPQQSRQWQTLSLDD